MSERDVREALVEQACEVMHDAYEAAAVSEGWETQERSRKPWADVPEANKATMRAAVRALLASDVLARIRAEARAEALREAAGAWQWGEWTALTAPIKAETQPQRIIGAAQAVTDWLRSRAALTEGDR